MIAKDEDGGKVIHCDKCGEFVEMDPDLSFKESWEEIKASGWRAVLDGDWIHKCPECVAKWARSQPGGHASR